MEAKHTPFDEGRIAASDIAARNPYRDNAPAWVNWPTPGESQESIAWLAGYHAARAKAEAR